MRKSFSPITERNYRSYLKGSTGSAFRIALLSIWFSALLVGSSNVNADIIDSSVGINSPRVVDFSQFANMPDINTEGPYQVGGLVGEDIEFTSSPGGDAGFFSIQYGLGGNGLWGAERQGFAGINASQWLRFTFNDGPVSVVGGLMNYSPGDIGLFGPFSITAYATDGSVIESHVVSTVDPILTPGQLNDGSFRGISLGTNSISAFELSGAFGVIDDLTFSRVEAVPEPSTIAILGISSCVTAVRTIRRRKAAARIGIQR